MAEKKAIKERIHATEKTYQITSAMNMVSTSKLKKTEKSLKMFRPISDAILELMESIAVESSDVELNVMKANDNKPCYIIIASDRGLIGNYNNALFKYFDEYLKRNHKSNDEFMVATIGYKAFSYAKKKGYNLLNSESQNVRDDILFEDFSEVSDKLIEGYNSGMIGKTRIFYQSYVNTLTNKIKKFNLLPIKVSKKEHESFNDYLFEPDKETVLNVLVKLYINYTIYRIILEAKTSEHASRMNAMKNAKDNAMEIEEKLKLLYNHARQNQITTELIDIINGSSAVK